MLRGVQHWLLAILPSLLSFSAAADIKDFDWESIAPSHNLSYTPCYGELQCARLIVPLDWQDESNLQTVVLAIAKLPAKVPETDPAFGGTIFTNPGGPSGSGIDHVLDKGHYLQDISGGNKHYEILSWDPRGVGFTSPKADCYAGDIAARDMDELREKALGPLDSSDNALKRHWAFAQAYGQLCEGNSQNGSILPYLTTPSVVQDMVTILDHIHASRDAQTNVISVKVNANKNQIELKKRKADDTPRMLYWGFSYGSVLGNTFASMYPGRIGRVILDGIVDADDYMKGTWLTNLQDTEAIIEHFYKSCFEAANACSLRRPSDTNWQNLKRKVDDFITQVNQEPISLVEGSKITVVGGDEILSVFTRPIYTPLKSFKRLADLLSGALDGNYTLLLSDLGGSSPIIHENCAPRNSSTIATISNKDAARAIKCGDGEDETKHGISHFKGYLGELKSQSPTLGAYWTTVRFPCSGWTIRPKWRFTGPFTTPKHDASLVEGKPAAPLLFLSSRLDPVTPLRNAINMAANHPGAAWVVQESAGHCSAATPSKCTKKIIQDYLEYGTLPESGTTCEADCNPWSPCDEDAIAMAVDIAGNIGKPPQQRPLEF